MYDEPRNRFVAIPFTVVRKGYAKDEVHSYLDRFNAELRVTATDRDAAAAQARNLASQLEDVRAENDELRRQLERLAVSPTTVEDAGDRISRMLRMAADEASEVRALAQAEVERLDKEAEAKRKATQQDFEATMNDRRTKLTRAMEELESTSRAEAAQRIKDATDEANEAEANRKATQQDFEATMNDRRTKLTRAMEELESMSRAEAAQRIKDATDEASRLISSATQTSERTHAKELPEEVSAMNAIGVRGQGSRTLLPASENL
ncbi:hypothetical protein ACFYO7_31025 [Nocardia salmonicida]|uniref:DivIVA domain-containing protein n=1 Tax=Nocardia salmonicida TaxID=53431 RepID=UPI0036A6B0B8